MAVGEMAVALGEVRRDGRLLGCRGMLAAHQIKQEEAVR